MSSQLYFSNSWCIRIYSICYVLRSGVVYRMRLRLSQRAGHLHLDGFGLNFDGMGRVSAQHACALL